METKIVLVTGVSSGIGQASARVLADAGCLVNGTIRQLEHAHANQSRRAYQALLR